MERAIGSILATFRMTERFSLVGTLIYQDVESNDTRLAYNRNQFTLSVRWEH
jgi:hypothetical protein